LREAKNNMGKSSADGKEGKTKSATAQTTVTTADDKENVQTIRIQLENARARNKKDSKSHKRIRRVIVESDFSSHEESDADIEKDDTSDSSDEDVEEVPKLRKVCPHKYISNARPFPFNRGCNHPAKQNFTSSRRSRRSSTD
jgi:hypothetical protein